MGKANPLVLGVIAFLLAIAAQKRDLLPDWIPVPNVVAEAKIALPGVSALVVYQDGDLAKLAQQQRDVIAGAVWTDKVPAGQYRVLDTNAEFTGESPFRPVFERRPADLPWAVISGPGTQYEGPMPSTPAEMAQLVEGAK